MKILSNKDYEDLLGQIKRAEDSANEAQKKIGKKSAEITGLEIKNNNLLKDLKEKDMELLRYETELIKYREKNNVIELEIKELKKQNQQLNSQIKKHASKISDLKKQKQELKKELKHKTQIIEN